MVKVGDIVNYRGLKFKLTAVYANEKFCDLTDMITGEVCSCVSLNDVTLDTTREELVSRQTIDELSFE